MLAMMRNVCLKSCVRRSAGLRRQARAGALLIGFCAGASISPAPANDASTTIDAYIGLAESYKVECTRDVHFGVHQVQLNDPNGDVTIKLRGTVANWDDPDLTFEGNGVDGISLSTASVFDAPQLGVCEVVGAPGTQSGTISFDQDSVAQTTIIGFNGVANANEYQFGDIEGPTNAVNSMLGELRLDDTTVEVDGKRNATEENGFAAAIGGEVQVPAGLVAGNLGGYKAFGAGEEGVIALYVSFDDSGVQ
ncbi:hypothetical protein [Spiribacter roseus]|uniref:Transferrin-binding protein-like solute binding protein n=1 Tax=Spiribacter roseus TaxID=1855875 RepID=A0ABV3RX56_9GAMM